MKRNNLFLLHLPPPVHGSSMVGLSIIESYKINKEFECSFINLLASQNITETGKVNLRKIFNFFVIFSNVFALLLKTPPQVCYLALSTTGVAFYKDLVMVGLLKLFRIKRIYHLHNKGISLHQHKLLKRICYRFVFQDAEVILLSNHLYSDIQQFVSKSKIHICPNGIKKFEFFSQIPVKKDEKIQILFFSNLWKSKGVYILLEACALLKKKDILFECVFIGGEGDVTTSGLNECVTQLELREHIIYQGIKHSPEKEKAFAQGDIFVFPTYKDCFPLVLLEAMSSSLPVISTFEGGIPDIIEDGITGFLVPQRDVAALAEKLELLITNPDLRIKMGKAGRMKYEKEFTLEIFENRMVEILNKVIDKN